MADLPNPTPGGSSPGPDSSSSGIDPSSMLAFKCKYGRTSHSVRLSRLDTLGDLKAVLYSLTDVPPTRQKILGLTKGKLPSDDHALLESIQIPQASVKGSTSEGFREITIALVGTPEELSFKDLEHGTRFAEVRAR